MALEAHSTRRVMVLEYIRENAGCTKTQVIKHMKGKSALVTTHKIIKDLVSDKIVLSIPDEKNSQMHRLYVNNRNAFTFITQELNKLETTISQMNQAISILSEVDVRSRDAWIVSYLNNQLHYTCKQMIEFMLQGLLVLTSKAIRSQVDSQFLYIRIAKLIVKLNPKYLKELGGERYVSLLKELYGLSPEAKSFAISKGINVEISNNLVTQMLNLRKRLEDYFH